MHTIGGLLSAVVLGVTSGNGTNPGVCVVEHCGGVLLACEIDAVCRTWSGCNQHCGLGNNALGCQIRCGDLYNPGGNASDFIEAFSVCAISEHHCVPQSQMRCPVPANAAAMADFNLDAFVSSASAPTNQPTNWYITRGLNPLFDCFDCEFAHTRAHTRTHVRTRHRFYLH